MRETRTSSGQCLGCPSSGHLPRVHCCEYIASKREKGRQKALSFFLPSSQRKASLKVSFTPEMRDGRLRERALVEIGASSGCLNGDTFVRELPLTAAKPIYLRPRCFPSPPIILQLPLCLLSAARVCSRLFLAFSASLFFFSFLRRYFSLSFSILVWTLLFAYIEDRVLHGNISLFRVAAARKRKGRVEGRRDVNET